MNFMFLKTKKLIFLYVFANLSFAMYEDPNFFEIFDTKLNFFEIIQNFGVTSKDKNNNTQLHLAVYYAHKETIEKLLKNPNLDINSKNIMGNTALHDAIYYGNLKVLNLLLSHSKININLTNNGGQTPLHLVVKFRNSTNALKLLLNISNINVLIKDNRSRTALDLARIYGKKLHENMLLEYLMSKKLDEYVNAEFEFVESKEYFIRIFEDSYSGTSSNSSSDLISSNLLYSQNFDRINLTNILNDFFPYLIIIEDYNQK